MDNTKYLPEVQEILDDPATTSEERELIQNLVQITDSAKKWRIKLQQLRIQNETKRNRS
jgi:hypothetical protein